MQLDWPRRAAPRRAVRRPTPAGRPRSGARRPAPGAPPGRAPRCPRPQAAPSHADRAEGHPAARSASVRLRHPRPGGGAHHERPLGRVRQGPGGAGGHAGRGLRVTRRPSSSRASSASRTSSKDDVASTILGAPGAVTVRPEKIRLADPGTPAGADECTADGVVARRRLPRAAHPVPDRARRRWAAHRRGAEPRPPPRERCWPPRAAACGPCGAGRQTIPIARVTTKGGEDMKRYRVAGCLAGSPRLVAAVCGDDDGEGTTARAQRRTRRTARPRWARARGR